MTYNFFIIVKADVLQHKALVNLLMLEWVDNYGGTC